MKGLWMSSGGVARAGMRLVQGWPAPPSARTGPGALESARPGTDTPVAVAVELPGPAPRVNKPWDKVPAP